MKKMMKKFLILIALILMQFVGKAQSSEETDNYKKMAVANKDFVERTTMNCEIIYTTNGKIK
jgi:hypothetical protein